MLLLIAAGLTLAWVAAQHFIHKNSSNCWACTFGDCRDHVAIREDNGRPCMCPNHHPDGSPVE